MKVVYTALSKSGPQPLKTRINPDQRGILFGPDHNVRMKPIKPQTASDLLVMDDEKEAQREDRLSPQQRLTLIRIAGDKYGEKLTKRSTKVPEDPYTKRKGETTEDYIKSINLLLGT